MGPFFHSTGFIFPSNRYRSHNFHRLQRHCDYALQKFEGISGILIFSPKRQDGSRDVWRSSVKIEDLISKWNNLRMVFYT